MKTFADLKRALSVGTMVTLTYPNKTETGQKAHKYFGIPRYVVKAQTNGVYLAEDKESKQGSFMELPAASLVDFDGDTFTIYDFGTRPLTADEKAIIDNEPSKRKENAEKLQNDLMSDGSQMYWADKKYYKELDMQYLEGFDWHKGLRYDFNKQAVWDKKIKGEKILSYKLN